MVTALVLLKVKRDNIGTVADTIAGMDGVSEVYSVAGRVDLAAIIRVHNNEALADLITGRLLKVEGITSSETMFAFKVHSKHDLERMFAIGM